MLMTNALLHACVAQRIAEENEKIILTWWEKVKDKDPDNMLFWRDLSINKNGLLRFSFVLKNLDKPWCWWNLSENPTVVDSWRIIEENPSLPWKYSALSAQPWLTSDIVAHHPDKEWCFWTLSAHPLVATWEVVTVRTL